MSCHSTNHLKWARNTWFQETWPLHCRCMFIPQATKVMWTPSNPKKFCQSGGRQVRVIITQSDHYHHWSKWFKWSSTPLALGVDDILGETGCAARSYAIPSDFIFTAVAHSITADQDVWCSSPWFYDVLWWSRIKRVWRRHIKGVNKF
jgi:hypothetical protein